MTVRVLGAAYREWGAKLFTAAERAFNRFGSSSGQFYMVETPAQLAEAMVEDWDVVALVGWSWIVPVSMIQHGEDHGATFVCLHPSDLPKYRGGSPLQWQILRGETESAISIFQLSASIDDGPIYRQCPLSLEGSLAEIFARIVKDGAPLLADTVRAIRKGEEPTPQRETVEADLAPDGYTLARGVWRRRTPSESEITWAELMQLPARDLYNRIRATAHPDYPPAWIRTADGGRLEFPDPARFAPGTRWNEPRPTTIQETTPDSYGVEHEVTR